MLLRAFSRRRSNLGPKPLIHSEGLVQMCSIGSDHGTRSCQSCVVTRKQIIMRANFLTETRSSCPYSSHPHSYPADHPNVPGTFFVSPYSLCYPQVTSAVAPPPNLPSQRSLNSAANRRMSLRPMNSYELLEQLLRPFGRLCKQSLFRCSCINDIIYTAFQQCAN